MLFDDIIHLHLSHNSPKPKPVSSTKNSKPVKKISSPPPVPSLLSPDFKMRRAEAEAKFNAYKKGFELKNKMSGEK